MPKKLKKAPVKFEYVQLPPAIRQTLNEWSAYLRP